LKFVPDVLFAVDTVAEDVAIKEAKRMNIPIVGVCDTNADPTLIDYPIPANDDSEKTIKLILETIEANIMKKAKSPQATARPEGPREEK